MLVIPIGNPFLFLTKTLMFRCENQNKILRKSKK